MAGIDKKAHIEEPERDKWNQVITDLASHTGARGDTVHGRATGTIPGFSINDYTTAEKNKLAGIESGALNNPHPSTHPYTMITGLGTVAHTNKYSDLSGIPTTFKAGGGNADTVGGIRITIGSNAPSNPTNSKELWIDTSNKLVKTYINNVWVSMCAVYA